MFLISKYKTVLFQDTDDLSSQQVVQLQPEQEVKGHHLGAASLVLSPHQLWLASIGRDGFLRIRETASMVGSCSCKHLNNTFAVCDVVAYNAVATSTGKVHRDAVSFTSSWWSSEYVFLCRQSDTPHCGL